MLVREVRRGVAFTQDAFQTKGCVDLLRILIDIISHKLPLRKFRDGDPDIAENGGKSGQIRGGSGIGW